MSITRSKLSFSTALIVSTLSLATLAPMLAHARAGDSAPVSVSAYSGKEILPPLESSAQFDSHGYMLTDLTVEQVQEDMMAAHRARGESFARPQVEYRRRDYSPEMGVGKVIIRVHKSDDPQLAEYLEVFTQNSTHPEDLTPVKIFDGGTSNQSLVSTAGVYGGHQFVTPSGVFGIDSMEPMHHSSRYNNAPMPWTMFFNSGIAIHAATPSEYKYLGRKASHGCVRVHLTNAKLLFDYVKTLDLPKSDVVIEILD